MKFKLLFVVLGMAWGMTTKAQSTVAIASACKDCPATITALSCAVSSAGVLQEGVVVSAGVTQTIEATVTKTGNYSFTTTANGITFSGSGTFTATGNQTVVLTATGVPVAAGTTTFSLSYGGQSCTFDRVVGASGPKIAAIGPTNLRFKQLGIQWGLTLDGDVYGWNGALEGKTLGAAYERINKSMTFTKVQNQPGKIAKIACVLQDQGSINYNMIDVFMVGVDGGIYVIEPKDANNFALYNPDGAGAYASPTNLTLIGDAGSGVVRPATNPPYSMTLGDQKKVIRKFPASPSGQLWKDIAPLSENYSKTGETYAVLGIDAAGRLFAATAVTNANTHNTTWKEIPRPAGSTTAFQYVKFIDTDVNEQTGFNPKFYARAFIAEGNDGSYYMLNKQIITAVTHATAFTNTLPKKNPLPAGKVVSTYRFYYHSVTTESNAHIITTDGSMYRYVYSTNTVTEVTKPKPTTQFIDFWQTYITGDEGIALTNEGIYEIGQTAIFSWKVNKQEGTVITPTAGLAGNWRSPRPENDYGTLFQQITHLSYASRGGINLVEGDVRSQYRMLMLDATGKPYYVIRTDDRHLNYWGVSEPGFFDGETGLYVTELLNGKYDDNNPYPEP